MCGRFVFSADDSLDELEKIAQMRIPQVVGLDQYSSINRDIYPSQNFPVITEGIEFPEATPMIWGYPPATQKSKSLLINARAETAADKYTFRYDFAHRRCLIPATGFYEWTKEKDKYLFTDSDKLLFIGGLYTKPKKNDEGKPEQRFVILTKAPDLTVGKVHNRMPVLIPQDYLLDWLTKENMAKEIIDNYSVKLIDEGPGQMSLF